jgi:hypothetical protein
VGTLGAGDCASQQAGAIFLLTGIALGLGGV